MNTKPIILIVEDNSSLISMYLEQLEGSDLGDKYQFLITKSMKETIQSFEKNKEQIAMISVDGEIIRNDTEINTTEWVEHITNQGFPSTKLIAASTYKQKELVRAGCAYQCDEKENLIKMMHKILLTG